MGLWLFVVSGSVNLMIEPKKEKKTNNMKLESKKNETIRLNHRNSFSHPHLSVVVFKCKHVQSIFFLVSFFCRLIMSLSQLLLYLNAFLLIYNSKKLFLFFWTKNLYCVRLAQHMQKLIDDRKHARIGKQWYTTIKWMIRTSAELKSVSPAFNYTECITLHRIAHTNALIRSEEVKGNH